MTFRRSVAVVVLPAVLFLGCTDDSQLPIPGTKENQNQRQTLGIHVFGVGKDSAFLRAARLAASDLQALDKQVEVIDAGPPDAVKIAGIADESNVLGALTVGGGASLNQAGDALDRWMLPVFELRNDLYERQELRSSVFQMSVPHSWEAYRLARYFGPGDRAYTKIGLIRSNDPDGETAAVALRDAASLRGLTLVETDPLPAGELPKDQIAAALSKLREARVQAVVAEGSPEQLMELNRQLGTSKKFDYEGRRRIADGWRPQLAGFSSLFAISEIGPGTVAAGEYGRSVGHVDSIEAVKSFIEDYERKYDKPPGDASIAYDAVKLLAEGVKRAGTVNHEKVVEALEGFDRVRFARLPVSFGPTDHVAPERDHLGLWAAPSAETSPEQWLLLMRTFTSDLERTNILEVDWPSFFEGTTPGGEAPFYHLAKRGIVSDRSDDLH